MRSERYGELRADHGVVRWFVSEKGTPYTNSECERRLRSAAHNMMRWFARTIYTRTTWDEADMNAREMERLRWRLEEIASYVENVQRTLDGIEGVDRTAERVKSLRSVAGRTPEEAAMFLAKADEIERRGAA